MNFITNNIVYNIKNNTVNGEDLVTLDGKWGILKGKGFSYNIENAIINLEAKRPPEFK